MNIKSLNIKKFRAVENVSFDFTDSINAFSGENGVGKTTVIDSILWILCDETLITGLDSSKNLDDNNSSKPVEVEMVLETGAGIKLELKREYQPKYTKEGVFSTYSNKFWINDASYSSSEYFARLKKEFGINDPCVKKFNVIRSLIDFDYFGTLDYQVAREVIEKILKFETDSDIINKKEYISIKNDLIGQNYDVSKTRSMYNQQITIKEHDVEKLKNQIKVLKETDKPVDKKELEQLKSSVENLKNGVYEHSAEYKSAIDKIDSADKKIKICGTEVDDLRKELNILELKNNNIITPLKFKKEEIANLRQEFVRVKGSSKVCPNCNFPLNKKEIEDKLIEIAERGKKLNNEIDELSKQVNTENIKELEIKINDKENELDELKKTQQENRNTFSELLNREDYEQTNYYRLRQQKIDELNNKIYEINNQSNTNRISELEKELNQAQEDYAKLLIKKELLADFEKDKINEINDKVKNVFPSVEFVLIEVSDRGAEKKTCKAQFNGVDYLRLNDGQRIKTGFEIISGLSQAFGVESQMPIVFDKLRDLSKSNIMEIKEKFNTQIFTTFVGNESEIKLYQM